MATLGDDRHARSTPSSDASSVFVDSARDEEWGIFIREATAAAASARGESPLGAFELKLEADFIDLTLTVVMSHRGGSRSIDTLTMRALRATRCPAVELARAAVERFGGRGFTSLTTRPADAPSAEPFEITVYFGSWWPYWATNVLAAPRLMSLKRAEASAELLRRLDVTHRRRGAELSVAARQLRAPVTLGAQQDAFEAALSLGLEVALYTAALPVVQSVRVAQTFEPAGGMGSVDLAISRGLSGDHGCSLSDIRAMRAFALAQLGLPPSALSWRVGRAGGRPLPGRRAPSSPPFTPPVLGPARLAPHGAPAGSTSPAPAASSAAGRVVGHLRVIDGGRA